MKIISSLFPSSDEYEFTPDKIFRGRVPGACPNCGNRCTRNGYNYVGKKKLGKGKVGKDYCPKCECQVYADSSFLKNLFGQFYDLVYGMLRLLRDSHVSWWAIRNIMGFISPMSKDSALSLFTSRTESFECPEVREAQIVHYDEQHPKRGRTQKFRLTLLNAADRTVIADELFDDKGAPTIEKFLLKHLNPKKELVIITDCDLAYPGIFKKIWGNKVTHQMDLMHLNKLVVRDFPRYTNLEQERSKYRLLNIFYNRDRELELLELLIKEQGRQKLETWDDKKEWLKVAKRRFYGYRRGLENERRRNKENLPQRSLEDAEEHFEKLWSTQHHYGKKSVKRLEMIKKNWDKLTAFYKIDGCPATNNALENYYSTSLKTHRKKQFRTDRGLENQMKLGRMKRVIDITKPQITLIEFLRMVFLVVT